MKIVPIIILLSILLGGCDLPANQPASPSKNQPPFTQQSTQVIADSTFSNQQFTCGYPEKFRNETFFTDFNKKVTDFVVNDVYPKNIDTSGVGDTEEFRNTDYIGQICYSKKDQIAVAIIFYDYQMMGGFSYVIKYDFDKKLLMPADMKAVKSPNRELTLTNIDSQKGDIFELSGSNGEGELVTYSAAYDYVKNIVYPK